MKSKGIQHIISTSYSNQPSTRTDLYIPINHQNIIAYNKFGFVILISNNVKKKIIQFTKSQDLDNLHPKIIFHNLLTNNKIEFYIGSIYSMNPNLIIFRNSISIYCTTIINQDNIDLLGKDYKVNKKLANCDNLQISIKFNYETINRI